MASGHVELIIKELTTEGNKERRAEFERILMRWQQSPEALQSCTAWLRSLDTTLQFYGAQTLLWHVRERYGSLKESAKELFDFLAEMLTENDSECNSRMVKGKLEQVLATLIIKSYPNPDLLTELLTREMANDSVRMRVLVNTVIEVDDLESLSSAQADLKSRLGEMSTDIASLISGSLNRLPQESLDLFSTWSTSFKSFRLSALPLVRQMLNFDVSIDLVEGVAGALLTWLDSGVEGLKLILLLPDFLRGNLQRVLEQLARTEAWEHLAILGKVYRLYGELVCDEIVMTGVGEDPSVKSFIEVIINLTLLEVRHAVTADVALFWVAYAEAIMSATGPVEPAKEVLGTILRLLLERLATPACPSSLGKYETSLGEVYVAIYGALEDRMLRLLLEGVRVGHGPLIRSCCVCFGLISSYIAGANVEALGIIAQVMREVRVPDRVILDLLTRQGIQRLLESSETSLAAIVPKLRTLYQDHPRATLGVLAGLMGPTMDELVLDWSHGPWPPQETDQLLLWTVLVQALFRLPPEDGRISEAIRMMEERLPSESGVKMLKILIERGGQRQDLLLAPKILQLLQWACQEQQRAHQRSDAPRSITTIMLLDLHMTALPIYAQIDEHSTWKLYSSLLHQLILEAGGEGRRGGEDNRGLALVREASLVMPTYRGHLADALIRRVLNEQKTMMEETLTAVLPLICRALRGRRRDEFPPSVTELGRLLVERLASEVTMADELLRPLVDCLLLSVSTEMASLLVTNGLRAAQRALTPSQVEIIAPLLLEAAQFDARSLASALGPLAIDAGTADLVRKLCACRLPRKFAALLGQLLVLTGRANLTAST